MLHIARDIGRSLRNWLYTIPAPPVVRTLGILSGGVIRDFSRHDGTHMAAGVAFYAVFSLFPLVLGTIAVAGFFVSSGSVQAGLLDFLNEQIPGLGDSDIIRGNIQGLVQARGALGIASIIGLFWSGRAVFGAVHRVVNRAWNVTEPHHFLVQQLVQIGIGLTFGFIFLLSIGLSTFGRIVANETPVLSTSGAFQTLWQTLFTLVPLVLSTTLFLAIYRFVPDTKVSWRYVIPAAVISGALFEGSKALFVWYLDSFGSFDRVYGSISTVVVLMVWTYVSSIILVVGAEIASEYSLMREDGRLRFRGALWPVRGGLAPVVRQVEPAFEAEA